MAAKVSITLHFLAKAVAINQIKDAREENVVTVIQSAKPLATVVWITLSGRL